MTRKNSLLARLSGGLSLAVLAAALTFGGPSALRAAEEEVATPTLQELFLDPIMDAVEALEHRISRLEASAGAWVDSLMVRRVVVHEICLTDESGAQTCISKGQLDSLMRNVARAEIAEPAETTAQANVAPGGAEGQSATETGAAQSEEIVTAAENDPAANPTGETIAIVVPLEAASIPVTEPSAALESDAPAVVESAATEAPAEMNQAPIAVTAENPQGAQELEHTGTIGSEAPAAPVAPLAQSSEEDHTATEEAPGNE